MDNIKQFPKQPERDLIAEMTGPKFTGARVCIDGRAVPNLAMIDRGDEIEFILDGRLSFSFPRAIAWLAASFAFDAMAIGAGFAHPSAQHFTQRSFAPQVIDVVLP